MRPARRKLSGLPAVVIHSGTSGRIGRGSGDVTRGTIFVKLVDLSERPYSQFDVMRDARLMLRDYPDYRIGVNDVDPTRSGGGGNNFGVDVNLVGPDLDVLSDYTYRLIDRLRRAAGLA